LRKIEHGEIGPIKGKVDIMNIKFTDGQEVYKIVFNDESFIKVDDDEDDRIDKITVCMENGQGALVPWFAIWRDDKIIWKHNGAYIQSVQL